MLLLVVGIFCGAPSLQAHGNTLIFVQVEVADDGAVTLELTMDIGEDSLIFDRTEAQAMLAQAVSINIGQIDTRLSELNPLRYEQRKHYATQTPSLTDVDQEHVLLTAIWSGHLGGEGFHFRTPEKTPYDVILWSSDATLLAKPVLLIMNEISPRLVLPQKTPFPWAIIAALLGAAVGTALGWRRLLPAS
jgi:hypothetical protein